MKKVLTESELTKIVGSAIRKVLYERSELSKNTNITVQSLDEFYSWCKNMGITSANVDNQDDYAFIEIGSGLPRWKAEVNHYNSENFNFDPGENSFNSSTDKTNPEKMFEYQFYFRPMSKKLDNVLRLIYDDNQKIDNHTYKKPKSNDFYYNDTGNSDSDTSYTCVKLSPGETNNGKDIKMYYSGAILSSVKDYKAIKDFVDRQLSKNPDIKFIIHCRQGTSRSASIATYVARKVAEIHKVDWEDYTEKMYDEHSEPLIPGKKHQFRIGQSRKWTKEKPQYHYPDKNTMVGVGDLEKWNDKNSFWSKDFLTRYGDKYPK